MMLFAQDVLDLAAESEPANMVTANVDSRAFSMIGKLP